MQNLNNQIQIMKENLEMKNLKNIKSSKFKTISTKDIKNEIKSLSDEIQNGHINF